MGKRIRKLLWASAFVFLFPIMGWSDEGLLLKVVDHRTGQVITDATVDLDTEKLNPVQSGSFLLTRAGGTIKARAHGYHRAERVLPDPIPAGPLEIRLSPLIPKALYLSFYGIGSMTLSRPAMKLIEETELNALVIDVKGDRGMIPYRSAVPLAAQVGAQRIITVRNMESLLASFKEKGIYTIARIVVFKDDLLATACPDLAVKTPAGDLWRDRENLAWVDPFRKEVWDYNIQIAVEAAKLGFDEVQFDYVRFPDSRSPRFSCPSTEESRVKAVTGFLQEARAALSPYNVFTAADIFGYVCWNLNDTDIGQKLGPIISSVDYVSPMLYPSGFHVGIPGYRNPLDNPHEIVYLSLKKAQERTKVSPLRFRPWLQAFRDYAFDRRPFGVKEVREQISAAQKFGSQGWMLWNPGNNYSSEPLMKEVPGNNIAMLAGESETLIK